MKCEEEPDSLPRHLRGGVPAPCSASSCPRVEQLGRGSRRQEPPWQEPGTVARNSGDGHRLRGASRRQALKRSCFFLRKLQFSGEEESEREPQAPAMRDAGQCKKPSLGAGTARRDARAQLCDLARFGSGGARTFTAELFFKALFKLELRESCLS